MLHSIRLQRELILMGHKVFNPLLYHYVHIGWDETPDEERWASNVLAWVEKCDAIFMGGFSEGCRRELHRAIDLNKIVYNRIGDIPDAV